MQSEYEKLKKEGYTEEQIQVELDRLSQIRLEEDKSLGEMRDDRSATIIDSKGIEQKTSSIMMGYNKAGIELENGEYVSASELEEALVSELSKKGEDVIYICTKTGKKVSQPELIESVMEEVVQKSSRLSLSEDSTIKNQDSAHVTIHDVKTDKDYNKGIFMLGNKDIQLPNGEYVLGSEIQDALAEYVALIPKKEEPSSPTTTSQQQTKNDEVYVVIKRYVKKYSWIPILIATVITLLKGFGLDDKMVDKYIQEQYTSASAQISQVHVLTEEEAKEIANESIVKLTTGDSVTLKTGTEYYRSSDNRYGGNDTKGVIGNKIRPEGNYNVDYFSIIHNGKIVKTVFQKGINLEDVLQETSQKLNVPVTELEAWLHAGGPIAGWVSIDDIIASKAKDYEGTIRTHIDKDSRLNGYSENFDGKTITFNNGTSDVTVTVADKDGNLLDPGSVVMGSDGEKYCLDSLSLEDKEKTSTVQVTDGKKLNWSIHNIGLEFALATASLGLVATIFTKREKKETTTMTDEQIYDFIERRKQEFAEVSEFQRAVETIVKKQTTITHEEALRNSLVEQNITLEDVEQMGGIKL